MLPPRTGHVSQGTLFPRKFEEAEPLVLGGHVGLLKRQKMISVDARSRLPDSGRRVVKLYQSWGNKEQALRWLCKVGGFP